MLEPCSRYPLLVAAVLSRRPVSGPLSVGREKLHDPIGAIGPACCGGKSRGTRRGRAGDRRDYLPFRCGFALGCAALAGATSRFPRPRPPGPPRGQFATRGEPTRSVVLVHPADAVELALLDPPAARPRARPRPRARRRGSRRRRRVDRRRRQQAGARLGATSAIREGGSALPGASQQTLAVGRSGLRQTGRPDISGRRGREDAGSCCRGSRS